MCNKKRIRSKNWRKTKGEVGRYRIGREVGRSEEQEQRKMRREGIRKKMKDKGLEDEKRRRIIRRKKRKAGDSNEDNCVVFGFEKDNAKLRHN